MNLLAAWVDFVWGSSHNPTRSGFQVPKSTVLSCELLWSCRVMASRQARAARRLDRQARTARRSRPIADSASKPEPPVDSTGKPEPAPGGCSKSPYSNLSKRITRLRLIAECQLRIRQPPACRARRRCPNWSRASPETNPLPKL